MNSETRICQNCKTEFVIEPADFSFYEKMKVPPPTFCPKCRLIRRMVFWNEHNLFRKKDALAGKEIFSTYPEESPVSIYEHDYWWSDAWDPMIYSKDYDFSKPFFAQFKELFAEVPWPNKSVRGMVESEYCNQASYLKDCYLCFNGNRSEHSFYCVGFSGGLRETMDVYAVSDLEMCYEAYEVGSCFQCFFCLDTEDCRNVWFSRDCMDCSDCFGCVNLRHRKHCIFNEQYTKEGYEEKIKELNHGSYAEAQKIRARVNELYLQLPHKCYRGTHNARVTGDYIYGSKNAYDAYEIGSSEDVRYVVNLGPGTKDSYDYSNWGENVELLYEAISCGDECRNIKFCFDCWPAMRESEYCANCHSSSNLFGCVGLRNKQYCILNKQYTKEEYEALMEKIKKHMDEMPYIAQIRNSKHEARNIEYRYGEFFPPELSPLAYNESKAIDYYPKSKEEVIAEGYLWRDPNQREFEVTLDAEQIPDHVRDAEEGITKEIIRCASCKKAYRILLREFQFYKKFEIPLPRKCHLCRYADRVAPRNPFHLYERKCECGGGTNNSQPTTNNGDSSSKSSVVSRPPDRMTSAIRTGKSRYANTAAHFHGEEPCPNEFKTTFAPDRPEIIYCEQCYQAEVA